MEPIILNDSQEILKLLNDIRLSGRGFCTESLLENLLDAGFNEPDYLNAYGEDPTAFYQGKSPAWAVYHIRQWKRVCAIYGGKDVDRTFHFTETP